MLLISCGNEFHSFGAATENVLSPWVTVLDFGSSSRFPLDDLKVWVGLYSVENENTVSPSRLIEKSTTFSSIKQNIRVMFSIG